MQAWLPLERRQSCQLSCLLPIGPGSRVRPELFLTERGCQLRAEILARDRLCLGPAPGKAQLLHATAQSRHVSNAPRMGGWGHDNNLSSLPAPEKQGQMLRPVSWSHHHAGHLLIPATSI